MVDDDVEYQAAILTVDVALFALVNGRLHVLLSKRDKAPYKGRLALAGGYVHVDEDADALAAAKRVARQKLKMNLPYLEQLATFSGGQRDPRGWSASISYIALISTNQTKEVAAELHPVDDLPKLAFDHNKIIIAGVERLRSKTSYSSLPVLLMPRLFTLWELQQVYEALMDTKLDKGNFRRKVLDLGIVEGTGKRQDAESVSHRPAELYRATKRTLALYDQTVG